VAGGIERPIVVVWVEVVAHTGRAVADKVERHLN
jgi:hypothetical protein